MSESKGAPVAVLKNGDPLFYCVPADTYAAILELVEASEMRELNERVHQLGLELFVTKTNGNHGLNRLH